MVAELLILERPPLFFLGKYYFVLLLQKFLSYIDIQGWADVFGQKFNHLHQELVIEESLLNNIFFINIIYTNDSM